mmetsp:Transcript_36862/g.68682  ORF Transcript_36862/g.68682 Transcript_36862/m.68682 type:complete len:235 (+) Transcript_36862:60-764(+)
MEASAVYFYQLGLGHLHGGDVRAAYEDFREAARIDPTDFQIWQKYEETYRQVEGDIAEQHREHGSDSMRTPLSSREQVKAPRHFTLKVSRSFSTLEAAGEDVDEENARAVFLRGGSLFASSKEPEVDKEDNMEMVTTSPRRYFFILVAWSLTWLLVVYHYRYQERRRSGAMGPLEAFGWVAFVLAVLAYVVWRHHQRPFHLRASDVIKILAVLVILICIVYHTSKQQAARMMQE